jgi:hydroxymethylpyrimidine pyrophosphatase-like HAD family hydrolase
MTAEGPHRYLVLASDYDGTLASQGVVPVETIEAVRRLKASGRKVVLVTGRILADLEHVFPDLGICDYIVAENGPVLYHPASGEEKLLAPPPPDDFVLALRHRGCTPLDVGRVVVATGEPYDKDVLEVVSELGLELQIIFNKGAVMVLPPGINKGIGLSAALHELGIPPEQTVAIGDAENDHSLLQLAGVGVAVANAIESLSERADFTTAGRSTIGVRELIGMLLDDDLASRVPFVTQAQASVPVTVVTATPAPEPGEQRP